MSLRLSRLFVLGWIVVAVPALAQTGRVEGRIARSDGQSVSGVAVLIQELADAAITDRDGAFSFASVPVGSYTVTFTLGNDSVSEADVEVTANQTTRLEMTVEWEIGFAETVTIYSASRRVERVTEAPASVTVVTEEEIERQASSGQLPKLVASAPGAQATQSGLYDFNFNVRGFNSSLNRRVATLIDGRDPSLPFLGAQEWAAISFPLDDLASIELVRGPSAALYGANASSGVLNMTSRQPRYSEGGMVRLSGGQLSSALADVRWAHSLGNEWYIKVVGGLRDSGDFTVSRNGAAEYSTPCPVPQGTASNCLPQEAVPLAREDDNEIYFGGVRFDKYLSNGMALTFEGATSSIKGPTFQTGIGRVQVVDATRPWARFNINSDHWNVALSYTKRDAPTQLALSSGANLALDTDRINLEGQTNWDFAGDRVRLVAGAAYKVENIDSFDPNTGRQSLIFEPIDAEFLALFGQVDWDFASKWKLTAAARYDDSDLYEEQLLPKASVVFSPTENQHIRLTYNEAFQVPNYSEFFLQADVAAPQDLAPLNALLCLSQGVDCGLGTTRIMALGNEVLDVETVTMLELGYSGVIGGKAYLTADYYIAENENFITDLLAQFGSSPGELINPAFGAWVGPDDAENTMVAPGISVADTVRAATNGLFNPLGGILSNNLDGSNIVAARSYTNAGDVDSQGVDLGLNYYFDRVWTLSVNYSWFDFDIKKDELNIAPLLIPNAPENSAGLGIAYNKGAWDWSIRGRWTDDFLWAVGPFRGPVESYTVVDAVANYRLNDNWSFGLNWANALDNVHYESFGGDLLGSRVLGSVTFNWE